jgi:hypothetical protein
MLSNIDINLDSLFVGIKKADKRILKHFLLKHKYDLRPSIVLRMNIICDNLLSDEFIMQRMLNSKVPRYYLKTYAEEVDTPASYHCMLKNVLGIKEDVIFNLYDDFGMERIDKFLHNHHQNFLCKGKMTTDKLGLFLKLYDISKDKKYFFDTYDKYIKYSTKTFTQEYIEYKINTFCYMNEKQRLAFLKSLCTEKDLYTLNLFINQKKKYKEFQQYEDVIISHIFLIKIQ